MSEVKLKSRSELLGAIIRIVREESGRNLSDVASSADISVSMQSQIERGVVSPSIDTLCNVCTALNLDVADLFKRVSRASPVHILKVDNRLSKKKEGARFEQLASSCDNSHPAELLLLDLKPGCKVGLSNQGHQGIEMGYVLKGAATLTIDGAEFEISVGDSVSYSSTVAHSLENKGADPFCAVWSVVAPHTDLVG